MIFYLGLAVLIIAIWSLGMSWILRDKIEILELTVRNQQLQLAALLTAKPHAQAASVQASSAQATSAIPEPAPDPAPVEAVEEAPVESPDPPVAAMAAVTVPTIQPELSLHTEPPQTAKAPVASRDFESLLGARWTVWVGACALALGGLFLVRYSIEQGYFGPAMRVASGLAFSALLAFAGEYLRRRFPDFHISDFENAPVAALLTAVATMSAFGTLYAAHALYGLLGPGAAFVCLALVGLMAVLAAALHGPWLAGLGLLGALATPLLVKSVSPEPWILVVYLLIVATMGYLTAYLRGWRQIAQATFIGIALWSLVLIATPIAGGGPLNVFMLTQMALAGLAFVYWPYRDLPDDVPVVDEKAQVPLVILTLLAALALLERGGDVWGAASLVALLLALAWRLPVAAGGALMAGVIALVELIVWPSLGVRETGPGSAILSMPLPDSVVRYALFAALFAAAIGGVSLLRLRAGPMLSWRSAGLYALAATGVPLAILVLCWLRLRGFGLAPEFGVIAGLLGVAMGWLAKQFRVREGVASAIGVEAFAAGAITSLALGLTMVLDRGYLTVSLALAAAGSAWVTSKGPVNALRMASGVLAAIVLARIAWDPAIMAGNPGTVPILNWLLVGYGVPAVAFFMAARFLRSGGDDVPLRLMEGMAILFGALLLGFEIRHLFHGADLLTARTSHAELGLQLVAGVGAATVLMRLDALDQNPVYRIGSLMLAGLSSGVALLGLILAKNPVLGGGLVEGGAIINSLVVGYALPAAAFGVLYLIARDRRPLWFVRTAGGLALVLCFAYVSLAVRRLFHDQAISFSDVSTGEAELWAYSAVWLGLGVILLAGGILRHARTLRLVSACFIVPSVLKVFLIDMSGLEGAWRALSFIGLGAALIGIGLVYQRFVFRKSPEIPLD